MVMLTMAKGGVASNIPDCKPRYFAGVDGGNEGGVRSLLDLPVEIKLRNSTLVQGKGYTPLNEASPVFEGLGCYDMAAPGNLDNFFDQLCVSDTLQREIITAYSKAIHDLGMDMGRKLLEGLGLSGDLFNGWPCQLRINKYNYTPEYVGSTGFCTRPGSTYYRDEIIGGLEAVARIPGIRPSMEQREIMEREAQSAVLRRIDTTVDSIVRVGTKGWVTRCTRGAGGLETPSFVQAYEFRRVSNAPY
ncbi:hypothetical protein C3L33_10096, partial [Rhododendron williamsianum]